MRTRWMIVSLVGALASRADAIDLASGKLTVSGFGEWGYGRTWNENAYLLGTKEGRYENAQFGLTVAARPLDGLVVAGQLFSGASGEVALDWGFAEWRVDDLLRIRVGKVKNPLGLFMEVKDIGTLRPFFALPQSIYGPTGFAAEAYLGAGATGEWQGAAGWGVAYDAYVGALEVPSFDPAGVVVQPPPWSFDYAGEEALATDVVGGRVGLLTPVEGVTARISGFTGKLERPGGEPQRVVCVGVSGEWSVDRFQVRGEWFRADEREARTHLGGYAEVAVNVLPRLQLSARYDESHQNGNDVPAQFRVHREGALGISYWPSANLVFKASYHRVDGNRFAVPSYAPDGTVDRRTDLLVAGAQFSF